MCSHQTLGFRASKNTTIHIYFLKTQAVTRCIFKIGSACLTETSNRRSCERKPKFYNPCPFRIEGQIFFAIWTNLGFFRICSEDTSFCSFPPGSHKAFPIPSAPKIARRRFEVSDFEPGLSYQHETCNLKMIHNFHIRVLCQYTLSL